MTDEVEQMQACLDAAYVKFNVRPLWWAKEALFEAMRTYAAQVRASMVEEAMAIDVRTIAEGAFNDMHKSGKSRVMCARWISERVHAALFASLSPPPQTEAGTAIELAPIEHELKTWQSYFRALADGSKTFEVRKNDRGFRAGDTLWLRETEYSSGAYTGRELRKRITNVLSHEPEFGLMDDFAILSLGDVAPSPPPEADGWVNKRQDLIQLGVEHYQTWRANWNSNGGSLQTLMARIYADWAEALAYRPATSSAAPLDEAWQRRPRALNDIAAERTRQIKVECWTVEHDDQHTKGELADAAACYAAGERALVTSQSLRRHMSICPWDIKWWKPTNRRRDLIKAAALIVAEIERLDRAALERGRP